MTMTLITDEDGKGSEEDNKIVRDQKDLSLKIIE